MAGPEKPAKENPPTPGPVEGEIQPLQAPLGYCCVIEGVPVTNEEFDMLQPNIDRAID